MINIHTFIVAIAFFIVQSAALALARMAGKKKAQDSVSLQIEVETDIQWRSLLLREGLIGNSLNLIFYIQSVQQHM